MGVRVSDTTTDTRIAAITVMANSWNSRPTMPLINNNGIKTAISETLIEITVKPISRAPLIADCSGVVPASRWRKMFSTTTMASSTTKPTAIVKAMSERLSRLKPKR
jgi:hypothetical protein